MIVRCANCHTEFSLQDHQIGPEGATVRCSVCSYVFPVDSPGGVADHPWQVRTVEDLLFTAADLATLRAWITEGRLHPDDQVSRTGKHWIRLGDMPEFSSVFSGFADLPPVFVKLDDADGPAIDELGPPPGFGETMPVVQGVDTDILVVRPEVSGDFEVAVTARTAAVERNSTRATGSSPAIPADAETSGPAPFPLAEVSGSSDATDDGAGDGSAAAKSERRESGADESAVRMRPRSHAASRPSSIASRADADMPSRPMRRRASRPTVRYGAEEDARQPSSAEVGSDDAPRGAAPPGRSIAEAVERGVERTGTPPSPAPEDSSPSVDELWTPPTPAEAPVSKRRHVVSSRSGAAKTTTRRRHRTFARDLTPRPARSRWPWVAVLGVAAGVALVFGVPSIRSAVMGAAGRLVGGEAFDPATLTEIEQARRAMVGLDPVAVGEAEAALQRRIDAGTLPPAAVAEMKLAQAELLATRALEQAVDRAVRAEASPRASASDDVERATRILGEVAAEHVVDRAHMSRVRARLRLALGRLPAEIRPLLATDDGDELRQLVAASPLWRAPRDPVPEGVIAGLESLGSREVLTDLVRALAYLRANDRTRAAAVARDVLARVPQQPTARIVLRETEGATAGGSTGSGGETTGRPEPHGTGSGGSSDDEPPPPAAVGRSSGGTLRRGKTESRRRGRTPAVSEGEGSSGSAPDDGDSTAAAEVPETPGSSSTPDAPDAPGSEPAGEAPEPSPKVAKAESVDALIEQGCRMVEGRDAAAGLERLRKAKSRRPGDLDMLLCTGKGHARLGRRRRALDAYEAALRRSPSFLPALREAAKVAARLGDDDKALRYYRRVLAQTPGDPVAQAYIDEHG